jgi:hypothetical protein
MSRANASKSGMGMWPGAYSLKWSSDASLGDIVCGGGGGGDGGGGSVGGSWRCVVVCVMWLEQGQ